MTGRNTAYPFSAVVGLPDLRLALLLNAVNPAIGGVLVRGEKGSAKSTVVRALAALLPDVRVVPGCRFSCDPDDPDPGCPDGPHDVSVRGSRRPARLVELPVAASEDRVVGSLDIERALTEGVKAYEPGLLASAHRGLLYVDEVNLLHDHLVDLLLDAAAMGRSYVEREGVSVSHAARFLLVGTMNPEEGELRPQLLDRFGLTTEVAGAGDPEERAEVVRRRLAYESDPAGFAGRWQDADAELADRIVAARELLPRVQLPDAELRRVAAVCAAFEVDGLRADLVTARTAMAHAAWQGRESVSADDVRQAARLALPHRRRRDPFDEPGLDEETLEEALQQPDRDPEPDPDGPGQGAQREADADPSAQGQDGPDEAAEAAEGTSHAQRDPSDADGGRTEVADEPSDGGRDLPDGPASNSEPGSGPQRGSAEQVVVSSGEPYRPRLLAVPGMGEGVAGRRSRARSGDGYVARARRPRGRASGLHLSATVHAAAPHQHARGRSGPGLILRGDDVREAVREGREANLVLFVVDASGSMAARSRMRAVKGAVLSLLRDAYQRRDKVGLVTFRGETAETALPPTSSADAAAARLDRLPTGGRTPLAAGLLRARDVLRVERLRDPRRRPLLVVVTDGRATGSRTAGADPVTDARRAARLLATDGVAAVVVDCEAGAVRLGLAPALAADLQGTTLRLEEVAAENLAGAVRDVRPAGQRGKAA